MHSKIHDVMFGLLIIQFAGRTFQIHTKFKSIARRNGTDMSYNTV